MDESYAPDRLVGVHGSAARTTIIDRLSNSLERLIDTSSSLSRMEYKLLGPKPAAEGPPPPLGGVDKVEVNVELLVNALDRLTGEIRNRCGSLADAI